MKRILSLLLTLVLLLGVLCPAVLADHLLTNAAAMDIGSDSAWDAGYTGQGMVIAVLDTGINTEHDAFQVYDDVLGTVGLSRTQAKQAIFRLGRGTWISDKIPYAWDYTSETGDVEDSIGHGSHVAGSAAGYVPGENGEAGFTGTAPGAQLLIMKVFSDSGDSASVQAVTQALEDAIALGADVINLSMGAVNGFSIDRDFPEIYEKLREAGILVCCAAGNEGNLGYEDVQYLLSADCQDYGVVSSPASLPQTAAIASQTPADILGYGLIVDGTVCSYTDAAEELMLVGQYGGDDLAYVMIPGSGAASDYEAADTAKAIAALEQAGKPWAAVVRRGELYFSEKLQNAAAAGAAAMICYNSEEGTFGMAIDDYTIPAVSVTAQTGALLQDATDRRGQGTLTVSDELYNVENDAGGLMADYSSWGTTSDLLFTPQLTAVGDDVWAPWTGSSRSYASQSGTSMASGSAAGAMAVALQIVRAELGRGKTALQQADLTLALLQSTAEILVNRNGVPYSPRQQGAGSINMEALLNAPIYFTDPAQSLGDDPACTGTVTLTLNVQNTGSAQSCTLEGQLLTELVAEGLDQMESRSLEGLYTLTAALNGKTIDPAGFSLPKGESTLTVTLQLTAEGLASMAADFPSGGYLEGFVTLTPKAGSPVHGSFLSFWGDWTQGSVLSAYDSSDILDAEWWLENTLYSQDGYDPFLFAGAQGTPILDRDGNYVYDPEGFTLTWAELGYTAEDYLNALDGDGITLTADLNRAYLTLSTAEHTYLRLLGENPQGLTAAQDSHNTLTAGQTLMVLPGQLRNARRMILLISDTETGRIYSVDDVEYLIKLYYDGAEWSRDSWFYWDLTDCDPASEACGEVLPGGTSVTVSVYAWEDYDTAAEAAYEALTGSGYEKYRALLTEESWQRVLEWSFPAVIDTKAPALIDYSFDPLTRELTLTLADDQALAYVELSGTRSFYTLLDPVAGTEGTVTVDLDDYFSPDGLPETVYVSLGDYAGNTLDETAISLDTLPEISSMALQGASVQVRLAHAQGGYGLLTVYDAQGTLLLAQSQTVLPGTQSLTFALDLSELPQGARADFRLLTGSLALQCAAQALTLGEE